MADFSYEIVKSLGCFGENKAGWTLELNYISWNGRAPKYDLRSWSPDHQKMGKGLTLSEEELLTLKGLLEHTEL